MGRVGMVVWTAEQATVWFPFFTDPEPKLLKVMPPKCGDHSADGIRQPIRLVGLIKPTTTTGSVKTAVTEWNVFLPKHLSLSSRLPAVTE